MSVRPRTCYARTGQAHVAYQVTGSGPVDLVLTPGFISHLDLQWESVGYRRLVRQLASFARVIRYDKRGTGLSDPVAAVPTLEQRVDDLGGRWAWSCTAPRPFRRHRKSPGASGTR
jgi:pimeloyl-ACP methyl ester carboxylesterase